jgi:hypothetical protein
MTAYADRILRGELTIEQVPEQIRPSVAHITLLPIHRLAVEVLDGVVPYAMVSAPAKEQRQFKLSRVPELLQPLVKAEAERIFNYRRSNGQ